MDLAEARSILAALEEHRVEYVLVGSLAMAAWGVVRATKDMDLFVKPELQNIERLKRALRAVFDDPVLDEISAEELAGEYPAVKYVPPDGDFSLDILARLGEAFSFEDIHWEEIEVEGVMVRAATPAMLYRMKRDTVRLQDRADAAQLLRCFDLDGEE